MYKRSFRNDKIAIDKPQKTESKLLPTIWKKNAKQLQEYSENTIQNLFFIDFQNCARRIDRVRNLLLSKSNQNLGQLISEAIFSHSDKQMTVAGIKVWFKTSTHVPPSSKAIKDCLITNSYFKQIKINRQTYWTIDEMALAKQPFGQYILDTGIPGGFEYWNGSRHYT